MKNSILLLFAFAVLLGSASCTFKKTELEHPKPPVVVIPNDTAKKDTTIKPSYTYNTNAKWFFKTNCLSCHGTSVYISKGGSISLEGYSKVSANLNQIKNDLSPTASKPMPDKSPNSYRRTNKDSILTWIAAGAKEK